MALLCQTLLGLDVDLPMQHSMPGLPASNLSGFFSVPGQPIKYKYLCHFKGSSCLVSVSMLCGSRRSCKQGLQC